MASAIVDKYIGESARVVREMFGYAKVSGSCADLKRILVKGLSTSVSAATPAISAHNTLLLLSLRGLPTLSQRWL